ncbi:MAG: hypothetical protein E7354_02810 [Clostridiales bacterium]|nr:hypothetical protein [Clostridiales bacterium]
MENKEEYIYLARLLTDDGADRLEDAMNGGTEQIGTINDGGSNFMSTVEVNPDYNSVGSEVARELLKQNAKDTMGCHSFFLYDDDLYLLEESISTLAKAPRDLEGYENLDSGRATKEDCFAADRPHLCIFKVPMEKFNTMCSEGLIGLGSGEYGTDYERVELNEAIVGDKGMRQILAEPGSIVAFASPEKVYDDVFGVDYGSIFGGASRGRGGYDDYDFDNDDPYADEENEYY